MKEGIKIAIGCLAALAQITLAATACPQNISPDVDPALCDPVSFEQAPDEFFTIIDAGFGKMKIRSVRAWAPRCADRFYNLVKHGFYDNQRFYRVTPAYIQFGYHADRVVNEDIYHWNCTANDGACFVTDTWQPSVKNNTQGTIAFGAVYESVEKFCTDINPDANVCQPSYETNGGSLVVTTELFISRVDNSPLGEYGFVPFAEIVEGFELTKDVYDQYGEVHGGSVGEAMCGANEICKGPNPDRIMEGNSYFDNDFPLMSKLNTATLAEADSPDSTAAPAETVAPAASSAAASADGGAAEPTQATGPAPTAIAVENTPTEVAVATPPNDDSGSPVGLIFGIVALAGIIAMLAVGGFLYVRRKRRSESVLAMKSSTSLDY